MNETKMRPMRDEMDRQHESAEPVRAPDLPPRYTSKEAKACILWAIAAVLLILTPYIFILADIREERQGVGGEGVVPIIAVVLIGVGFWVWAKRGGRRIEIIGRTMKWRA